MRTPELNLEEKGGMCLLLGATILPTPHVLPTNRQSCISLHRRDNLRSAARVPVVGVQRHVPLLSRNYVRAGLESDAVSHRVYGDTAETVFVGSTDANLDQKVQAVF